MIESGVPSAYVARFEPEEFPAWLACEGKEFEFGDAGRISPVMACYCPLEGFYARGRTRNGKRKLVFPQTAAGERAAAVVSGGEIVEVPCGKCEGCLLDRSQEWATRCEQEASLWKENVFVTLTYSADCLPVVGGVPTLRPSDFVLFMKRLRKEKGPGVRFLQAGEYGKLGRPHHHALLFNCGFSDREMLRSRPGLSSLFRSKQLERLWPYGYSSIGEVTHESAAYVARYTVKKFVEPCAGLGEGDSQGVRGSAEARVPEYMTMSLKPGIGAGWFERFKGDVFPLDEIVIRGGRKVRPPRYYGVLYERSNPEGFARVKAKRESRPEADSYAVVVGGKLHTRLMARRELARRRIKELKREV